MGEVLGYTPVEAASQAGIGRNAMYQLIASGEVPAIRIGRKIVVPASQLAEWMHRRADQDSQNRRAPTDV